MTLRQVSVAVASCLAIASAAQADVVYTYTGNAFNSFITEVSGVTYTAANKITGSITLADGNWLSMNNRTILASEILAFDFSDGRTQFTKTSTDSFFFRFSSDAQGALTRWTIDLYDFDAPASPTLLPRDWLSSVGGTLSDVDIAERRVACTSQGECASQGYNQGTAGTWAVTGLNTSDPTPTVPEPQSLALALLALMAMPLSAMAARRRG